MKKKTVNAVKILTIIMLIMIFLLNCQVFAKIIDDPDEFKPTTPSGNEETAREAANRVIGIIKTIGSAVSVLALILIGIGYMTKSAEGKAEYKKTMIPYIIGCVLVFAGSTLVQIIYDWAKEI